MSRFSSLLPSLRFLGLTFFSLSLSLFLSHFLPTICSWRIQIIVARKCGALGSRFFIFFFFFLFSFFFFFREGTGEETIKISCIFGGSARAWVSLCETRGPGTNSSGYERSNSPFQARSRSNGDVTRACRVIGAEFARWPVVNPELRPERIERCPRTYENGQKEQPRTATTWAFNKSSGT